MEPYIYETNWVRISYARGFRIFSKPQEYSTYRMEWISQIFYFVVWYPLDFMILNYAVPKRGPALIEKLHLGIKITFRMSMRPKLLRQDYPCDIPSRSHSLRSPAFHLWHAALEPPLHYAFIPYVRDRNEGQLYDKWMRAEEILFCIMVFNIIGSNWSQTAWCTKHTLAPASW